MAEIQWIKLSVNMFDDEKIKLIRSMPEGDSITIVWIQLLSLAGKRNDDGMIYISRNLAYTDEMLATILNHPLNTIRLALQTLEQFQLIETNQSGIIHIRNWDKHQNIDGMDRVKKLNAERNRRYRERKKQEQLEEPSPNDVSVTSRDGTEEDKEEEIDKDKNKNNNSRKSAKRIYDEDSVHYQLAQFLFQEITKNNPEARTPNFQTWADDIRKMMELDGRKELQVQNMITWSQEHEFWSGIILSAKKLRDKYDQMRMQALNPKKPNKSYSNPNPKIEALPAWAEQPQPTEEKVMDEQTQQAFMDRLKRFREG